MVRLGIVIAFLGSLVIECQNAPTPQSYMDKLVSQANTTLAGFTGKVEGWTTRLTTIKQEMAQLSTDQQKSLQPQISPIETNLAQLPPLVNKRITDAQQKTQSAMQAILDQLAAKKITQTQALRSLSNLLAQFNQVISDTSDPNSATKAQKAIEPPLVSLEVALNKLYTPAQQQKINQKTQDLIKKQQAYQASLKAFFAAVSKYFSQFSPLSTQVHTVLQKIQQGTLPNSQDIQDITQKYLALMNAFAGAYKQQGFPVDFGDTSNFVTVLAKQLLDFYARDSSFTNKIALKALKKKDSATYFSYLLALAKRLQGTGNAQDTGVVANGYESVIKDLKNLFTAHAEGIDTYLVGMKQMNVKIFGDALNVLVKSSTPSDNDLTFAAMAYKQIVADSVGLDVSIKAKALQDSSEAVGTLYAAHGTQTLKSLKDGSNTKNITAQALADFKQAAAFFKQAQDTAGYQQYTTISTTLSSALDQTKQADSLQTTDKAQAAHLYQQAADSFTLVGDVYDAQRVNSLYHSLQAQVSINAGRKNLQAFVDSYKSQFQAYLRAISTLDKTKAVQLTTFEPLLNALQDSCKKALALYQDALKNYDQIEKQATDLQQVASLLDALAQSIKNLLEADQLAQGATSSSLINAQTYYQQAFIVIAKAENSLSNKVPLDELMPCHISLLVDSDIKKTLTKGIWNYQYMVQRHAATKCIEVAQGMSNTLDSLSYYQNAYARLAYLPDEVNEFLSDTLKTFSQQKDQLQQLVQKAQTQEAQVQLLTKADWVADPSTIFYSSKANDAWKDTLNTYYAAFLLGSSDSLTAIVRVAQAYAQAYYTNVDTQYLPSIGAALIYYKVFALDALRTDATSADALVQKMSPLLKEFFTKAQTLQDAISKPDLLLSATDNQIKLVSWTTSFDQALNQQDTIVQEASAAYQNQLMLLSKTIANEQTTYQTVLKDLPTQFSITLGNLQRGLGDIYKKIADQAFDQKEYTQAFNTYKLARQAYQAANHTELSDNLKDRYELSYTRALVDAYRNLVIPNQQDSHGIKTTTVAGISVPEHYEIANYLQQIPTYIPLSATLQQAASDSAALENILLNYAFLLYVDNALKDNGINYTDVFDGLAQKDPLPLPDDQAQLVKNILADAYRYEQTLQQRIADKRSTVTFKSNKDDYGNQQSFLGQTYIQIPIMAIPDAFMTAPAYRAFPQVFTYYSLAQKLSDPSTPTVTLGKRTYVSGNDAGMVQQMITAKGQASLTAATTYQKRVGYLLNGGDVTTLDPLMSTQELGLLQAARSLIQKVKTVSKTDFTVQLSDYIPAYSLLKKYSNDIIISYLSEAIEQYQAAGSTTQANAITTQAIVATLQQLGDAAQLFLVGDPQDPNYFWGNQDTYGGVLADIRQYYLQAIGFSNNNTTLLNQLSSTIATLCSNAGDLVAQQKNNPLGAVVYYALALGAYKGMSPNDATLITKASLKWLGAYYNQATTSLTTYQQLRNNNAIAITLSTGDQEQLSFQELLTNAPTGDPAELAVYETGKHTILDAIIYYQSCGIGAQTLITDSTDDALKQAHDLVASYTLKKGISFDTPDAINQWMARADFTQTLTDAFTFLTSKISGTNASSITMGYMALNHWCQTLYAVLGQVFIGDFYGQSTISEQYENLMSEIKAEQQAIVAPAQQWVG